MRIRRLYFRDIRNHVETELHAAERVNVITGLNGHGKTTILEAIALCTLTRSFVALQDAALLRRGEHSLIARVEGTTDYDAPRRIEVRYNAEEGKKIALDGMPAVNAAQVIGAAPTVVLSPDLKEITVGPPTARRKFLDLVLSQAKRRYLEDLIQYRRLLKHRNAMLKHAMKSGRGVDPVLMEQWDEGLIDRGARVMSERTRFLREFAPILRDTAFEVAVGADEFVLRYQPDGMREPLESVNEYRDALWLRSKEVARTELRRGTTLFGPHRDDVEMLINGGDVRVCASQGQHKTLLIGLKVAEFHYLARQCAETPIILLDDIFGELDARRAERVYDITRNLAQVFITVVSFDMLPFLRGRKLAPGDAHVMVERGGIAEIDYGDGGPPLPPVVDDLDWEEKLRGPEPEGEPIDRPAEE